MLITASGVMRGNKKIDLKAIADKGVELAAKEGHKASAVPAWGVASSRAGREQACAVVSPQLQRSLPAYAAPATWRLLPQVPTVVVHEVKHAAPRADTKIVAGRDVWWEDAVAGQAAAAEVEWVDAEHPLFLLYTSGSTGEQSATTICTFLGGLPVCAFACVR